MEMNKIKCPKCGSIMTESTIKGSCTARDSKGEVKTLRTAKFICMGCGYVQEYAIDPFALHRN